MTQIKHRGGLKTSETYQGIPVHAANGVHEPVTNLLLERLPRGARVADLGAGHGALTRRLRDNDFKVTAFDLDCSDWLVEDVACYHCDFNGALDAVAQHGTFDA